MILLEAEVTRWLQNKFSSQERDWAYCTERCPAEHVGNGLCVVMVSSGAVWPWSLEVQLLPCGFSAMGGDKEWLFWCEEGVKQHWESMSRCLRSQSLLEWGGQRSAQSASWSLTSARWSRTPEPQLVVWFIGNSFSYLKGAQEQIAFVSCGWWRQQILGMELGAKLLFGNTDSLLLLAASIFE